MIFDEEFIACKKYVVSYHKWGETDSTYSNSKLFYLKNFPYFCWFTKMNGIILGEAYPRCTLPGFISRNTSWPGISATSWCCWPTASWWRFLYRYGCSWLAQNSSILLVFPNYRAPCTAGFSYRDFYRVLPLILWCCALWPAWQIHLYRPSQLQLQSYGEISHARKLHWRYGFWYK